MTARPTLVGEGTSAASPRTLEADIDEGTPLLHEASKPNPKPTTPLPKLQLFNLMLLQMAEPITSQCITPFVNQLVRELDITGGDERKVGYYVGLIVCLPYIYYGAYFVKAFFASPLVILLMDQRFCRSECQIWPLFFSFPPKSNCCLFHGVLPHLVIPIMSIKASHPNLFSNI